MTMMKDKWFGAVNTPAVTCQEDNGVSIRVTATSIRRDRQLQRRRSEQRLTAAGEQTHDHVTHYHGMALLCKRMACIQWTLQIIVINNIHP